MKEFLLFSNGIDQAGESHFILWPFSVHDRNCPHCGKSVLGADAQTGFGVVGIF